MGYPSSRRSAECPTGKKSGLGSSSAFFSGNIDPYADCVGCTVVVRELVGAISQRRAAGGMYRRRPPSNVTRVEHVRPHANALRRFVRRRVAVEARARQQTQGRLRMVAKRVLCCGAQQGSICAAAVRRRWRDNVLFADAKMRLNLRSSTRNAIC